MGGMCRARRTLRLKRPAGTVLRVDCDESLQFEGARGRAAGVRGDCSTKMPGGAVFRHIAHVTVSPGPGPPGRRGASRRARSPLVTRFFWRLRMGGTPKAAPDHLPGHRAR
eukprot:4313732-Prymnesium_polylepis.1